MSTPGEMQDNADALCCINDTAPRLPGEAQLFVYGVPVASVQETSIRASMGKAVEQNEGHFPRLSWAKTLGFLHV